MNRYVPTALHQRTFVALHDVLSGAPSAPVSNTAAVAAAFHRAEVLKRCLNRSKTGKQIYSTFVLYQEGVFFAWIPYFVPVCLLEIFIERPYQQEILPAGLQ